ncbi:hypothetical protein [Tsukamurella soli]|uniref:hypothetical protein n=1 Tax=Tsukamurella soli TaxID=644556 RepID=UPI003623E6B1
MTDGNGYPGGSTHGYGGPNPVGGPGPGQFGQSGPGGGPFGRPGDGQQWPGGRSPAQPGYVGGPPPGMPFGAGQYGQPQFAPPPPRRNRKPLIITALAGVAVVVIVVIVVAVTLAARSGGGAGSAGDAVKGYLAALARGDADAALAYGVDQPASRELLTDDVLKQQIAKWPITNVRILDDTSSGNASGVGMATVHVAATFGTTVSDATVDAKKVGNTWKLATAAVKITADVGGSEDASADTLTVFGKPAGTGTAYVFPGYQAFGSSDPYLDVTATPLLLDKLDSFSAGFISAQYTLNDVGKKAINDALVAAFAPCQKSKLLAPRTARCRSIRMMGSPTGRSRGVPRT